MARRIADDAAGRTEAVRVLRAGGVVAIPTDTVYGIAVALDTPGGIERLFAAKQRPPDKAIALLLADVDQASAIGELTPPAQAGGAHRRRARTRRDPHRGPPRPGSRGAAGPGARPGPAADDVRQSVRRA